MPGTARGMLSRTLKLITIFIGEVWHVLHHENITKVKPISANRGAGKCMAVRCSLYWQRNSRIKIDLFDILEALNLIASAWWERTVPFLALNARV